MSAHEVRKFYKKTDSRKRVKESSLAVSDPNSTPTQDLSATRKVYGGKEEWAGKRTSLSPSPKKKICILTPKPLWRVFPRQQMAFDFSRTCYQNSAVFAFESEEFGKQGQRKYLVTTYYEFGQRYLTMKGLRHYYEVIVEDSACRLYFDIEFKKELNPSVDGVSLLETFIEYVCHQLYVRYGLVCDRTSIVDLDSSTTTKFSRHLIFHLPSSAFSNNIHAGHFVHHCCDQLRSFKSLTDSDTSLQEAYSQRFPTPARSKKTKDTIPQCPSASDLRALFVLNEQGKEVLLCDEGVYTRNRNFRLYLSSKLGKGVPLLVSKENRFKSTYGEDLTQRRRSQKFNTLMDSLVCNVSFETCSRVLEFTSPQSTRHKKQNPMADNKSEAGAEAGYHASPYPHIDTFITSTLTKGGVQGSIRRWTYFSQGKQIVYDILHNRWCENVGRAHKSNNIMIVADLMRGVFYQKCHDPECKRINFRSSEKLLPAECNPVPKNPPHTEASSSHAVSAEELDLSSLVGNITDEDMNELEADTSYESDDLHEASPDKTSDLQFSPSKAINKESSPVLGEASSSLASTVGTSVISGVSLPCLHQDDGTMPLAHSSQATRSSGSLDSDPAVDALMLEALVDYESSIKNEGADCREGHSTHGATESLGIEGDSNPADYSLSVEEMNSFCEDFDDI